jgi:hypothetical protein
MPSILDAVFLGASGAIANRRNSKYVFPLNLLALGLDHIAVAYQQLEYSAPKQI